MRTILTALALSFVAGTVHAQVPRSECFPIERVPASLRARAEAVLLETLDSTALYTLIGGLKPMTSEFLLSLGRGGLPFERAEMKADSPVAQQVDELRQIFTSLRCGDDIRSAVVTDILNTGGRRGLVQPYVFHMPAVSRVVAELPEHFGPLAITPHTSPETMLFTMNRLQGSRPDGSMEAAREWGRARQPQIANQTRAFGLLYGYPRPAVEAFVSGTLKAVRGEAPPEEKMDPALAMRIPNFREDAVWYRKPTVEDGPEDRTLRERAARILAEYRKRREQYIGDGKPGIVALLRDWFCSSDGSCRAANADVK